MQHQNHIYVVPEDNHVLDFTLEQFSTWLRLFRAQLTVKVCRDGRLKLRDKADPSNGSFIVYIPGPEVYKNRFSVYQTNVDHETYYGIESIGYAVKSPNEPSSVTSEQLTMNLCKDNSSSYRYRDNELGFDSRSPQFSVWSNPYDESEAFGSRGRIFVVVANRFDDKNRYVQTWEQLKLEAVVLAAALKDIDDFTGELKAIVDRRDSQMAIDHMDAIGEDPVTLHRPDVDRVVNEVAEPTTDADEIRKQMYENVMSHFEPGHNSRPITEDEMKTLVDATANPKPSLLDRVRKVCDGDTEREFVMILRDCSGCDVTTVVTSMSNLLSRAANGVGGNPDVVYLVWSSAERRWHKMRYDQDDQGGSRFATVDSCTTKDLDEFFPNVGFAQFESYFNI